MPEQTESSRGWILNPEWEAIVQSGDYYCPINALPPVDLVPPHLYTDRQYAERVAKVWAEDLPFSSGRLEDRTIPTREQFDEGRRATAKSWVNPYAPYTK